jgi:hypothetical protein
MATNPDTRRPNAIDAVYTEADMYDREQALRQEYKDREFGTQLATLSGRLDSLPATIKAIAREAALEVLRESNLQHKELVSANLNVFSTLSNGLNALTALGVLYLALHAAHVL